MKTKWMCLGRIAGIGILLCGGVPSTSAQTDSPSHKIEQAVDEGSAPLRGDAQLMGQSRAGTKKPAFIVDAHLLALLMDFKKPLQYDQECEYLKKADIENIKALHYALPGMIKELSEIKAECKKESESTDSQLNKYERNSIRVGMLGMCTFAGGVITMLLKGVDKTTSPALISSFAGILVTAGAGYSFRENDKVRLQNETTLRKEESQKKALIDRMKNVERFFNKILENIASAHCADFVSWKP